MAGYHKNSFLEQEVDPSVDFYDLLFGPAPEQEEEDPSTAVDTDASTIPPQSPPPVPFFSSEDSVSYVSLPPQFPVIGDCQTPDVPPALAPQPVSANTESLTETFTVSYVNPDPQPIKRLHPSPVEPSETSPQEKKRRVPAPQTN